MDSFIYGKFFIERKCDAGVWKLMRKRWKFMTCLLKISLEKITDFQRAKITFTFDFPASNLLRFQSHGEKMRFKTSFFVSFYSRFILSIHIKSYLTDSS